MSQTGSLEETLREVIGETMKPQEQSSKETTETTGEVSGETKSGETPEYVRGIDISDVPEADRPRIKDLLSKKVALVEKGTQAKFQEIAKYKKEKDSLLAQGLTEDEAVSVLRSHIEQKRNSTQTTTQAKSDAVRTLDKMINDASDRDTRDSLQNLRKIVKEESNTAQLDTLLEKVDKLEKFIGFINQDASEKRIESINNSLNSLTQKYGKDLVDKYREDIVKQGLAYPKADVKRLMSAIADPDEIEQAILSNSKTGKVITKEKLNAITSQGSGVTGSVENVDVSKTSYKNLLGQILKK